jgi:hypothetical protein
MGAGLAMDTNYLEYYFSLIICKETLLILRFLTKKIVAALLTLNSQACFYFLQMKAANVLF